MNLATRSLWPPPDDKKAAWPTPLGSGAARSLRVRWMTRRFLPGRAPAHGSGLLEAPSWKRPIGPGRSAVKPGAHRKPAEFGHFRETISGISFFNIIV